MLVARENRGRRGVASESAAAAQTPGHTRAHAHTHIHTDHGRLPPNRLAPALLPSVHVTLQPFTRMTLTELADRVNSPLRVLRDMFTTYDVSDKIVRLVRQELVG